MFHAFRPIPALIAAACLTAPSHANEAEKHAETLVDQQYELIFLMMHPTATLQKVTYKGAKQNDAGIFLTYTFTFEGFIGVKSSTMGFQFDDRGNFSSLKLVSTTSPVEPFTASKLALALLKDMVKEIGEVDPDGEVAAAIDAADVHKALELILKLVHDEGPEAGEDLELDKKNAEAPDDASVRELRTLIGRHPNLDREDRERILRDELPRMNKQEADALLRILRTQEARRRNAEDSVRGGRLAEQTKETFSKELSQATYVSDKDRESLVALYAKSDAITQAELHMNAKAEQRDADALLESNSYKNIKESLRAGLPKGDTSTKSD